MVFVLALFGHAAVDGDNFQLKRSDLQDSMCDHPSKIMHGIFKVFTAEYTCRIQPPHDVQMDTQQSTVVAGSHPGRCRSSKPAETLTCSCPCKKLSGSIQEYEL